MTEDDKVVDVMAAGTGPQGIELGKWMGRREAFGLIAGRCSAAEMESLRQIRDGKLYLELNSTWDEFCEERLHVTRRTVDREIGYLKRFGPAFFTLRQLARVSVRDYAAIAGQVSDEGVRVDGTVVALLPENSGQLAEALETLRKRNPPAPPAAVVSGFESVLQRFRAAAQGLRSFEGTLDMRQMQALGGELAEVVSAAADCGISVQIGG